MQIETSSIPSSENTYLKERKETDGKNDFRWKKMTPEKWKKLAPQKTLKAANLETMVAKISTMVEKISTDALSYVLMHLRSPPRLTSSWD